MLLFVVVAALVVIGIALTLAALAAKSRLAAPPATSSPPQTLMLPVPPSGFGRGGGAHGARWTLIILVVGVCVGLPLFGGGAPARAAIDLGADLMRVTNLDRVALGRSALAIDPTLVGLAGSAPYHCPSSSGMLLAGRATDMAQRGYFSHGIEGCADSAGADYTIIDVLASQFGYDTYRAEDIGAWAGDPSASATYQAGCDVSGADCAGETATVSAAVAWAEGSFMVSPEHRSIILGTYDRFGCSSAQAGDARTYSCACSRWVGQGPATVPRPPWCPSRERTRPMPTDPVASSRRASTMTSVSAVRRPHSMGRGSRPGATLPSHATARSGSRSRRGASREARIVSCGGSSTRRARQPRGASCSWCARQSAPREAGDEQAWLGRPPGGRRRRHRVGGGLRGRCDDEACDGRRGCAVPCAIRP